MPTLLLLSAAVHAVAFAASAIVFVSADANSAALPDAVHDAASATDFASVAANSAASLLLFALLSLLLLPCHLFCVY